MVNEVKVAANNFYNMMNPPDKDLRPDPNFINIIHLEKDGKYMSMQDSTWFEEELEKHDKIQYNKELDSYKVVGPRGFNMAFPGDLVIRLDGLYFVIDKTCILLFLIIAYGSCFMDKEKDEE